MAKFEERNAITLQNKGEKVFCTIHRPLTSEKVPAVLFCSGFGGNKVGKYRLFVRLSEELTKRGIACLRFDYRGSGDSEGEPERMSIEDQVSDTLCCLNFLQNDPQIDSNRIGILGRSFGGVISILAVGQKKPVKAVALWAPVFDSAPWHQLWNSYRSNQLDSSQMKTIKTLPGGIPNMNFLSQFFKLDMKKAIENLDAIPLLHIQALQDATVSEEHAQAYRRVREEKPDSRFIKLPNSDHDFSDPEDQQMAIQETCMWFQKLL